jgi:DNA polymerase-3 subunit gamma/tau
VLGLVDWRVLHELCDALLSEDVVKLLRIVEDVVVHGKDLSQFAQEILRYYRNLLVLRSGGPADLLALPEEEITAMRERAGKFTLMQLVRLVEQFAELATGFDSQIAQRTALEAMLIRVSKRGVDVSVESVLEKLALLREGGAPASSPAPRTSAAAVPAPTAAVPKPAPAPEPSKKKSEVGTAAPAFRAVPDFGSSTAPAAKAATANGPAAQPPLKAAARVTPEDAQQVKADPHVQQVVEKFRGKIVDVKRTSPKAEEPAESE